MTGHSPALSYTGSNWWKAEFANSGFCWFDPRMQTFNITFLGNVARAFSVPGEYINPPVSLYPAVCPLPALQSGACKSNCIILNTLCLNLITVLVSDLILRRAHHKSLTTTPLLTKSLEN